MVLPEALPASFRDPSGFVYEQEGILYRHVAPGYTSAYTRLMESGLYNDLTAARLLIAHEDLGVNPGTAARTLRPERLPFIAHPYEWCFSQFKAAAKATLAIQRTAIAHGMTLKDASAYNIAFRNGQAVLLDTLSFDLYTEGQPWAAYRQFCEHFLAPLALMAYRDVRLSKLLRTHLDGIPLDLASRLLPWRTRLNPALMMHIHMHASAQQRDQTSHEGQNAGVTPSGRVGRTALLGILDSLEAAIDRLNWEPTGTTWAEYYSATNYTDAARDAKVRLVGDMLAQVAPTPRLAWDFGANDARFSRLASELGAFTVAWDIDPAAVERAWREVQQRGETHLLPLVQDLMNPSPQTGWELNERASLLSRGPADVVLALALVHHLALGNNVPLPRIARFFAAAGRWLLVEFVPKRDSQSQRLLAGKGDIFPGYDEENFAAALNGWFRIVRSERIPETERTLYLCERLP
jgi:hypothetical protein